MTPAVTLPRMTIALVVFCGTRLHERIRLGRDLLIDMDLRPPVPWGRGHVHRGFHDALDEIWGEVERRLTDLAQSGQRSFWFTGHSMGAAIATLAAARWQTSARRAVYTFGSPRVGDRAFVVDWDQAVPVYRFVHGRDLITRIPPKLPLLKASYTDLGTEQIRFGADGGPAPTTSFRTGCWPSRRSCRPRAPVSPGISPPACSRAVRPCSPRTGAASSRPCPTMR